MPGSAIQSNAGLVIAIMLIVSACASTAPKVSVKADQDLAITNPEGVSKDIKRGEAFELEQSPLLLEAKGYNGILLVPISASNADVSVKMRPISEWGGDAFYKASNSTVSSIISGVVKTQQLLAANNFTAAVAALDKLQEQHPKITYLHFLRASVLIMMNKKQEAQVALERALKDFPDDPDGKALYESLTGKNFESQGKEAKQ